jgi:hypothetical protein
MTADDVMEQRDERLEQEAQARQLAAQYRMHLAYEKITTPTISLLMKTKLLPWESLESLLYRASRLNHLTGISNLERALMLPKQGALAQKRHLQLSIALGANLEDFSSAIPTLAQKSNISLYSHLIPAQQLALTSFRVCAQCITEIGYGKSYWTLSPFVVCEIHSCMLIDSCPACDKPLSGARPTYETCGCGNDLSTTHGKPCAEHLSEMSQILVSKFIGQPLESSQASSYPDKFRSLGLRDMLDLLSFLGSISRDPGTTYLNLSRRVVSLRPVYRRFQQATDALMNWPTGFHKLLAASRSFTPSRESLAGVYDGISHISGAALKFLQPESHRLISEGIDSFLRKPSAWSYDPASRGDC